MSIEESIEKYFAPKEKNPLGIPELVKMISEEMGNLESKLLTEADTGEGRFSVTLSIPKLVPSEAWGDPDSQSRKEINKIFESITGGTDIAKRIDSINKFLTPAAAKRKQSPRVIINMMMVTEALQATLNDYNDSAAGFVFEGFMAALTGGKQIAGKVGGTLPIEDFVAFSEFGAETPVSLKLLSPKTDIKGSFTNIVDFLFIRGAKTIKYLVAYKLTQGEKVDKLQLFAFDITQENFVEFINITTADLLAPVGADRLREVVAAYEGPGTDSFKVLATTINGLSGYNSQDGLFGKYLETGELPSGEEPSEEEKEATAARKRKEYAGASPERLKQAVSLGDLTKPAARAEWERQEAERAARKAEREKKKALREALLSDTLTTNMLNEAIDRKHLTLNEAFHYMEKLAMLKEKRLLEAKGDKKQWSASRSQIFGLKDTIKTEPFGELDLSQSNIDALVEIYSEILKGGLQKLLTATKNLTENVGEYYSEKSRGKAQAANKRATDDAEDIGDALEKDPRFSEENPEEDI